MHQKRIEENTDVSFLKQTIRRALVDCYVLLFIDFVKYWTLVCRAQWSRFSR